MSNQFLRANQEFVKFKLIQDSLGLKDPIMVKNYLTQVFKKFIRFKK